MDGNKEQRRIKEKEKEVRRRHTVKHRKRQGIKEGKVEKTQLRNWRAKDMWEKDRRKKKKRKKESTHDTKRVAKKKGMLDKEKAKD